MATLTDSLEYDEELSFEEQSDDVKAYINTRFSVNETEVAGEKNRVVSDIFKNDSITITRTRVYKNSTDNKKNGLLKKYEYELASTEI